MIPERGPLRVLCAGTLVNTVANGAFMAAGVLFFIRAVGLSPGRVGLGLTVAGVVGVTAGVPVGRVCDSFGARRLLLLSLVAEAILTAALALAHGFPSFLALIAAQTIADAGARTARATLVGMIAAPADRVRFRAYVRSITNVGITVGGLLGAIPLALDEPRIYPLTVVLDAVTYLLAAAVWSPLPADPPRDAARSEPGEPVWLALRDAPYVAVTALDGLLSLQHLVYDVAIPLWLVTRTHDPKPLLAVLLAVNTVMIVMFQVRFSRGAETALGAALSARRGGRVLAIAVLIVPFTAGTPETLSIVLLLIGATVHATGELWHAASSFGLSYELARPEQLGEYQGAFGLGIGFAKAVGPGLLTLLCITWGRPGWVFLAGLFLVAGGLQPVATRWAIRTRPLDVSPSVAGL